MTDDERVLLQPEEIEALPEMREWMRATWAVLDSVDDHMWVVRFLRNLADQLEANIKRG